MWTLVGTTYYGILAEIRKNKRMSVGLCTYVHGHFYVL